ncbi:regulatory protein [Bacillus oleivorans]|uniref:Regulatory protein RecX n=1 Tax=Bacillus oleivorans TaxID=1448271 RepID=A0A285CRZ3_9BACI|nr:recombination regulator RecX [Bacillus oleivorans]SNX70321.1 regulatory protein [Bacillus oleivorans]
MIVSKITPQKKNQGRYNIYVSDGQKEEYAFSVDEHVLVSFQLKKGKELSDFDIQEIQYQDQIRKGIHLAANYLTARMRSREEVKQYLLQKEIDEAVLEEVLHHLEEYNYIKDDEYAIAFVKTYMQTSDKGPTWIMARLKEKGISPDYINKAMDLFTEERAIEKAIELVEKWSKGLSKFSTLEKKQKLYEKLVQKGYQSNVISISLEEANWNSDEDEEWNAIVKQGEKAWHRYGGDRLKVKQFLFRKGFEIDLIERFIHEKEEEI